MFAYIRVGSWSQVGTDDMNVQRVILSISIVFGAFNCFDRQFMHEILFERRGKTVHSSVKCNKNDGDIHCSNLVMES